MSNAPDVRATLKVELCGKLADGLGDTVSLSIPADGCCASDLLELAVQQHPGLARHLSGGRVKLCVNETIVGGDAQILPQDDVALFPPVSGG